MRFTSRVPGAHPGEAGDTTRLADYMRWLETQRGLRVDGYHELWAWSVNELDAFWESLWQYFGVESETLT